MRLTETNRIDADLQNQTALGNVADRQVIYKFGRSENITVTESVIWDGGEGYDFQETAVLLDIKSTSGNDTNGGTGAEEILIKGLDENYNLQEEIVILNGTSIVSTTNTFISVYSVSVIKSGDGIFLPNAGDISISVTGTSTLQAKILEGQGQTQMCLFIVPAGYSALVTSVTYSSGAGKNITMRLRTQKDGGAFTVNAIREVYEQNVVINLTPPIKYDEKTKIVITGTSDTGTQVGAASFNIILVKNKI